LNETPRATHGGDVPIGDLMISAAVLDDGTRVLSERGVTDALGAKRGGSHWQRQRAGGEGADLPVYLSATNLQPFIPARLRRELQKPIRYLNAKGGGRPAHGIRAERLLDICNVWLDAEEDGALLPSQMHIATKARILRDALATVGIIALVDEATGYQTARARDALEKILERFIAAELSRWAKTFPDEFYQEMFRLRGWDYSPSTVKRPGVVGTWTNDLVYERLAPGVLDELRKKNPTNERGRRKTKHFQWLTEDVGHPRLREHLYAVIGLMRASSNWDEFYRILQRAFPKQNETLPLLIDA